MTKIDTLRYKQTVFWVIAIILGLVATSLTSCSTNRAIRLKNKSIEEWSSHQFAEIKKSPEGENGKWVIYSRKIKETNLLEYKIEGAVGASSEDCILSFRQDMLRQAADLNNEKYPTYEIVSASKDSLLTYVIHKEPFPLKDTEMSTMYVFSNNEEGTEVIWNEAWAESKVQPSKKLKRVETFSGSWEFRSIIDGSCEAVNSIRFDPKGMPSWLYEPMVIKFLKGGLKNIREDVAK